MKTVRLLFNDDMARAIVEGRKTVTRRPVALREFGPSTTPGYDWCFRDRRGMWNDVSTALLMEKFAPCAPGDLLIGRECWRPVMESWRSFVEYRAGGELDVDGRALFVAERGIALRFPGAKKDVHTEKWHPSNHMPDWAARIRRRVVSVTVERVQDITEDDAVREGFVPREPSPPVLRHHSARDLFFSAWDSIYAAKCLGSDANPWVWRIEFGAENVEGEL